MSRKARIKDEEKEGWGRIRMFVLSGGYGPVKPRKGTFDSAIAVLSDSSGGEGLAGLVSQAVRARRLVLGDDDNAAARSVVVLDLEPLKREIEAATVAPDATTAKEKQHGWAAAVEAEGAKRDALGKMVGKAVAKALTRLMMSSTRSLTLVACGALAPVALKPVTRAGFTRRSSGVWGARSQQRKPRHALL